LPQLVIASHRQGIAARPCVTRDGYFLDAAESDFPRHQRATPLRVNLSVAGELRIFRGGNVAGRGGWQSRLVSIDRHSVYMVMMTAGAKLNGNSAPRA
jgi:hypothetical protein